MHMNYSYFQARISTLFGSVSLRSCSILKVLITLLDVVILCLLSSLEVVHCHDGNGSSVWVSKLRRGDLLLVVEELISQLVEDVHGLNINRHFTAK